MFIQTNKLIKEDRDRVRITEKTISHIKNHNHMLIHETMHKTIKYTDRTIQ